MTQYGTFGKEHLFKIQKGLDLYNRGLYWECHEELEDPWYEDMGDAARYVYWAVIQIATALHHVKGDNLHGAIGQLSKALEKIEICEKQKVETPLLFKALKWKEFKDYVRRVEPEKGLRGFQGLEEFKFPLLRKSPESNEGEKCE